MDNVSYRNSRPNQPRDISQPKPQQSTESASPRAKFSGGPAKRRPLKLIALVAGILLLALVGWFAYGRLSGSASVIDSSKYQAVFFTNGQVYFGKLFQLSVQDFSFFQKTRFGWFNVKCRPVIDHGL